MPWVSYPRLPVDRAVQVLVDLKLLIESPAPSDTCPAGANADDIIAETVEWSRMLDKDELAEVLTRADLTRVSAPSGLSSGSRDGMRARVAAALRLQLAPRSKGSIRSYFKSAALQPAAAESAGVRVTDVCAAPLRSKLRGTVLTMCALSLSLLSAVVVCVCVCVGVCVRACACVRVRVRVRVRVLVFCLKAR
jgi:hypothetical protein